MKEKDTDTEKPLVVIVYTFNTKEK